MAFLEAKLREDTKTDEVRYPSYNRDTPFHPNLMWTQLVPSVWLLERLKESQPKSERVSLVSIKIGVPQVLPSKDVTKSLTAGC